jgi:hypothetical protein
MGRGLKTIKVEPDGVFLRIYLDDKKALMPPIASRTARLGLSPCYVHIAI